MFVLRFTGKVSTTKIDGLRRFLREMPQWGVGFAPRRTETIGGRRLAGGRDLNELIARVQARHGRNVWFISGADRRALARIIREGALAVRPAPRRTALRAAEFMTRTFRTRIERSTTFKRPLTPRYEKWKRQAAPGRPILWLTGQLKDSMKPKVI